MDDSPNQPTVEERPQEYRGNSSIGPMAGIIIVVILLAIGGIYFFITQEMKLQQPPPGQEQVNS